MRARVTKLLSGQTTPKALVETADGSTMQVKLGNLERAPPERWETQPPPPRPPSPLGAGQRLVKLNIASKPKATLGAGAVPDDADSDCVSVEGDAEIPAWARAEMEANR